MPVTLQMASSTVRTTREKLGLGIGERLLATVKELLDPSKAKEEGSFMAMESRMELRPSERHLKVKSKLYTFVTASKIDLIYLRDYSQDKKIVFNKNRELLIECLIFIN